MTLPNSNKPKEILLPRGFVAICDEADYDYLNQWKWYLQFYGDSPDKCFAYRKSPIGNLRMHHDVYQIHGHTFHRIKHLNGNRLDNRFSNLAPDLGSRMEERKSDKPVRKDGVMPWESSPTKTPQRENVFTFPKPIPKEVSTLLVRTSTTPGVVLNNIKQELESASIEELNHLKAQRLKTAMLIREAQQVLERNVEEMQIVSKCLQEILEVMKPY